jgi:hypothetical protein
MIMRYRLLIACGLMLVLVADAHAQGPGRPLEFDRTQGTTRVGTRGANFLEIGVGARAQALAGAFTANASGPSALAWNTAATALQENFAAGFSHTDLFKGSDIAHRFLGALVPTRYGVLGASVIQLSSGDMVRTTERYPRGGDPGVGNNFEWTAMAVGLHFASRITDRLAVGGAAKFATEGISGANAGYVGVDLSTLFDTGVYGVRLGASLMNLGTTGRMSGNALRERVAPADDLFDNRRTTDVELVSANAALPTSFRLGVMTDLIGGSDALLRPDPVHRVRLLTDLTNTIDSDLQSSMAVEYSLSDRFFVRGGKRWANEHRASHRDFSFGLSAGAGLQLPITGDRLLKLDYGYVNMADLNYTQVISIEVSF